MLSTLDIVNITAPEVNYSHIMRLPGGRSDLPEDLSNEVIEEVEEVGESGVVVEEFEESRKSKKMNIIADLKDPEHKSRCPYCDEWIGKLHGGSIYLYTKYGRLYALADMDHVFDDCRHGLIENIRFLYRMMVDLKARFEGS